MAKKKGTEPERKSSNDEPIWHAESEKPRGSQTNMPQEQDPERRIGNFGGAGEPPRKQPGRRQ